jgi:hypothetical protein
MNCPSCHQGPIHRAHARGWLERTRKQLTRRQPHRCALCGWRGWMSPVETLHHQAFGAVEAEAVDLRAVDAAVARIVPEPAAGRRHAVRRTETASADAAAHRLRS